MDINQIIKERRSHYPHEFSGQIIEDNIIDTLLENACWAPNHTLNFPWRFKVLKDEAMIQWLDKAIELYKTGTPPEKFNQKKVDKMVMYKIQVSHVIVIVLHSDADKKSVHTEDICAVACGVQNMYLSLSQFPHASGYWSTGLGTYKKDMHNFLKLTNEQQLMGYFMLGHIEKKRTESNRKDHSEFIIEP